MPIPELSPRLLRQLELLRLRSRRAYLGSRQGGHLSLRRGHGMEFSDYRKYEPGDSPRHIDWGVYARSERLYVKRFREEQDLPVHILIDTSASMFVPSEDGKWDTAAGLALAIAYVALMQQDTVRIIAPELLRSPVCHGGASFHLLKSRLGEIKGRQAADFSSSALTAVSAIRYPGALVFISDFLMPIDALRKLFDSMRAKNLDITAVQILGKNDLDPLAGHDFATTIDSESGESIDVVLDDDARRRYARELDAHNAAAKDLLARAGVRLVSASADEPIADIVMGKLSSTGLLSS